VATTHFARVRQAGAPQHKDLSTGVAEESHFRTPFLFLFVKQRADGGNEWLELRVGLCKLGKGSVDDFVGCQVEDVACGRICSP
jgi:hypothetical protein